MKVFNVIEDCGKERIVASFSNNDDATKFVKAVYEGGGIKLSIKMCDMNDVKSKCVEYYYRFVVNDENDIKCVYEDTHIKEIPSSDPALCFVDPNFGKSYMVYVLQNFGNLDKKKAYKTAFEKVKEEIKNEKERKKLCKSKN